jgi:hypothetical protein
MVCGNDQHCALRIGVKIAWFGLEQCVTGQRARRFAGVFGPQPPHSLICKAEKYTMILG